MFKAASAWSTLCFASQQTQATLHISRIIFIVLVSIHTKHTKQQQFSPSWFDHFFIQKCWFYFFKKNHKRLLYIYIINSIESKQILFDILCFVFSSCKQTRRGGNRFWLKIYNKLSTFSTFLLLLPFYFHILIFSDPKVGQVSVKNVGKNTKKLKLAKWKKVGVEAANTNTNFIEGIVDFMNRLTSCGNC